MGNPDVAKELIATETDSRQREELLKATDATSRLKRLAIRNAVEMALYTYGHKPQHRFGMSDDDPGNVDLIIKVMADCKTRHPEKRNSS